MCSYYHNIELDGQSELAHWLSEEVIDNRKSLFRQMDKNRGYQNQGPRPLPHASSVVLNGKWKILADNLTPLGFFDLEKDHRELYNLLGTQPNIEKQMIKELETFLSEPRDLSVFQAIGN